MQSILMNASYAIELKNSAARLLAMTVSRVYESGNEALNEKYSDILTLLNTM